MWGVILALQSSDAVHLGVDNRGVVRHIGRLLDGCPGSTPFELATDGDLLLLFEDASSQGLDTVRVTKVKGHADEGMVVNGRVREVDRLGNNAADEAADFGRRRVDYHSRPNQFERFRGVLELICRFEFDFLRRENFFERFEFLVCSKFNHTQWPYMCMCCGLSVPTQFHSECYGVIDGSR